MPRKKKTSPEQAALNAERDRLLNALGYAGNTDADVQRIYALIEANAAKTVALRQKG